MGEGAGPSAIALPDAWPHTLWGRRNRLGPPRFQLSRKRGGGDVGQRGSQGRNAGPHGAPTVGAGAGAACGRKCGC